MVTTAALGTHGKAWSMGWLFVLAVTSALPTIRFDHPPQDFEFTPAAPGDRVDVALVFAALADPGWRASGFEARLAHWERWSIIIEINAVEVARWRAAELINALGFIAAHVAVPDLPQGEHVASCRLAQQDDKTLQDIDSLEHTITFFVRDSPPPPPPPLDMWTPLLCGACLHAVTCSSKDSPDMHVAADNIQGLGARGIEEDTCSGHGACHIGSCLCAADWAGEKCEHSILRHTSFLPGIDPSAAPSQCAKSTAWESSEVHINELFERFLPSDGSRCPPWGEVAHQSTCLQGNQNCSGSGHSIGADDDKTSRRDKHNAHADMLVFGPPMHGLGFNVHYVSHMVAWALERHRVPAMVETPQLGYWPYGHIAACPPSRQGWACLFEPLSACDSIAQRPVAAESAAGEPTVPARKSASSTSSEHIHSRADGIPKVALAPPAHLSGEVLGVATHGALWWRAQLVTRILRPSPLLYGLLRKIRNALSLRGPYISVHVRMGDSCTHPARYASIGSPTQVSVGCQRVLCILRHGSMYKFLHPEHLRRGAWMCRCMLTLRCVWLVAITFPRCAAVCCSVLQCVAVCCSVVQCVAVCCSVLQCVAV